jgi:ABC-type multidrug transport system fused ATPase/permease subunit
LIKNSGVEASYLHKYSNSRLEATTYDIFTWMKANSNGKLRMTFFAFSKAIISLQLIYQAFLGRILVGDVFAIWSWTNQAFENIFNIVRATKNLPKHFAELDKYLNIIDKKPEFDESGDRKFENGNIVFDQVSFQYPKAHAPVIDNLSLTIPKGKKVAFIGFSGSGKSTLIKLLLRIYDWGKGDIRIANKSLRNIHSPSLRQRIGYVEQHVDLFDTSIEENIVFGVIDKKTDKTRINELVHKARIDQFFHRLGDAGLGTIIGERGVKLSGGERQRIGIARALAKDPDILIFDEATASLDTENEKFIQEAIDESSKGRTTIVIAHRLSTVQNSDIIFVMDKGRLVGSGTHEDLLETSHEYRRLLHAQKH